MTLDSALLFLQTIP